MLLEPTDFYWPPIKFLAAKRKDGFKFLIKWLRNAEYRNKNNICCIS